METLRSQLTNSGAIVKANFTCAEKVCFDAVYLESIFVNLVTNAIKYAAPGRPLELNITSHNKGDTIQVVFEDNGIGMNMDMVKDKIFGLYQRFHNNPESKGIGLYLVRSQLTTLGGNIVMESCVDTGTAFTLTFKKLIV